MVANSPPSTEENSAGELLSEEKEEFMASASSSDSITWQMWDLVGCFPFFSWRRVNSIVM